MSDVNEGGLPSFGLLYYVQAEQTLLKPFVTSRGEAKDKMSAEQALAPLGRKGKGYQALAPLGRKGKGYKRR